MKLWLMSASYQLPRLALPWLIAFNWLLQHQDLHVRQCKRCGISLPRRFPSMRTGRMRLQRVKQVIARCSMRVWLVPIQLLFKLNCRYILWLILRRIVIHMWFALYNCFFGLWRVYLSSLIDMCVFTCAPPMISYYSIGSIVLQKQFLQFLGSKVPLNQYFSIHVEMQF